MELSRYSCARLFSRCNGWSHFLAGKHHRRIPWHDNSNDAIRPSKKHVEKFVRVQTNVALSARRFGKIVKVSCGVVAAKESVDGVGI